jgi:hypothetical protein
MLTLLDAKQDSELVSASGVCGDSRAFVDRINSAQRNLLPRGDWVGTVVPIQFCVRGGCLVMNRYVQRIDKLNICNHALPIGNLWYNFLDLNQWRCGGFSGMLGPEPVMFAEGWSPTYNSVFGDGRLIRAFPRTHEDVGKTVRLFGVDNGNQPLRTNNGDGTWSEGIAITLALPFGSTSVYVRRIDRVVKDVTQGQVLLYAYDPAKDVMEDLAIYDPGETSPSYAKYRLELGHMTGCSAPGTVSSCCSVKSVVALVKLKFIPARFDTDLIFIDSLSALTLEVQAVKRQASGDIEGFREFQALAINQLNREIEEVFPDSQAAVSNAIFGPDISFSNRSF